MLCVISVSNNNCYFFKIWKEAQKLPLNKFQKLSLNKFLYFYILIIY